MQATCVWTEAKFARAATRGSGACGAYLGERVVIQQTQRISPLSISCQSPAMRPHISLFAETGHRADGGRVSSLMSLVAFSTI
jgi:hypothetical protein